MKTARTSRLPPFCTQIVGSFPKPRVLLDLLTRRQEFTPERFTQIMDDLVRFAVRTQGLCGLDVVSDGQWRGTHKMTEFLRRTGGFAPAPKVTQQGPIAEVVVQRMNPTGSLYKADADFLVNNTARLTKFAIPSPAGIAAGFWHEDYSKAAYPTREAFMDHLVAILAAEVHALVTAGIDIIQIDDRDLLRLCNPASGALAGEVPAPGAWSAQTQLDQTRTAINRLVDSAQGKAEIHLHCCPGRTQHGAVDYAPLFARLPEFRIDRINIGFVAGAGRIEDLALLPAAMDVGLGVLDMRPQSRQSVEDIQALARAAAAILPSAHLALTPDCSPGAGGGGGGDAPGLDEAYDRLRRLTAAARGLRTRHS